jgi:hypothetical protein
MNLGPKIWLSKFLGETIKGRDFNRHTFEFWNGYRPLLDRKYREVISEVDVTIAG